MNDIAAHKRAETVNVQQAADSKNIFGFWVYLMTDCLLFASLFATYAVLHNSTNGGPGGDELFSMPYVLAETIILLTSSFTCGLAMLATYKRDKQKTLLWLGITVALGLAFLAMELTEFRHLVIEGNSWRRSGFLSAYFTLVGTHGLHITFGIVWMVTMIAKIARGGLVRSAVRKLTMLSLFWHFLDVVWIFIFSIVYLLGVAQP